MSERKVLQKYYPPDYDPSKEKSKPRRPKGSGPVKTSIRMMAPFSFQCNSCGGFTMRNTKFNARKEESPEKYLGQKIFIFALRCPSCSAEIKLKTDPKNGDYLCESGAKRNFTPWRDEDVASESVEERLERLAKEQAEDDERKEREKLYGRQLMPDADKVPDGEDAMAYLEQRMSDAKREMEKEEEIDELRTRNARIDTAVGEGLLDRVHSRVVKYDSSDDEEEKQDAQEAARAFKKTYNGEIVRRVGGAPPEIAPKISLAKISKSFMKKPRTNSLGVMVKRK